MMLTGLTSVRAAFAALLLAGLIAAASPAVAQKEWLVHSFPTDGHQGSHTDCRSNQTPTRYRDCLLSKGSSLSNYLPRWVPA
jgi:hypothetical protein